MFKTKKSRYIAFQLHHKWGVLDRKTGELVQLSNTIERYPEAWARNRAEQLNKEDQK